VKFYSSGLAIIKQALDAIITGTVEINLTALVKHLKAKALSLEGSLSGLEDSEVLAPKQRERLLCYKTAIQSTCASLKQCGELVEKALQKAVEMQAPQERIKKLIRDALVEANSKRHGQAASEEGRLAGETFSLDDVMVGEPDEAVGRILDVLQDYDYRCLVFRNQERDWINLGQELLMLPGIVERDPAKEMLVVKGIELIKHKLIALAGQMRAKMAEINKLDKEVRAVITERLKALGDQMKAVDHDPVAPFKMTEAEAQNDWVRQKQVIARMTSSTAIFSIQERILLNNDRVFLALIKWYQNTKKIQICEREREEIAADHSKAVFYTVASLDRNAQKLKRLQAVRSMIAGEYKDAHLEASVRNSCCKKLLNSKVKEYRDELDRHCANVASILSSVPDVFSSISECADTAAADAATGSVGAAVSGAGGSALGVEPSEPLETPRPSLLLVAMHGRSARRVIAHDARSFLA
jgi:hypothetical protein